MMMALVLGPQGGAHKVGKLRGCHKGLGLRVFGLRLRAWDLGSGV